MKKMLLFILIVAVSMSAWAGGGGQSAPASPSKTYTLTLGTHLPASSSIVQSFEFFVKEVKEKSNGRITVNLSSGGALGSQREIVEAVNLGTVEMVMGEGAAYANFVPAFGMLSLPFLYTSEKQFFEVMDGKIGQKLEAELSAKTNLVVFSRLYTGMRDVYSTKPMTSLDSLRGLKIRTPESNVYVGGFRALGANPTAIAATEMYTALQQGVVDAMEGIPDTAYNYKIYEVGKNCLETGHIFNEASLAINKPLFNSMPADLQKVILDAGIALQTMQRNMIIDANKNFKAMLIKEGMVYAPIDVARATAIAADFHKTYIGNDRLMQELYAMILALPK